MRINSIKIEMMLAERAMTKTELAAVCGISRQTIRLLSGVGHVKPKMPVSWRLV